MSEAKSRKTIRSYRLVFRRRWRIFRIQGWRIPLPGGLELRLIGYWLASLTLIALLGRLPLLGTALSAAPASLRLLALPIAAAWALSRWEIDGRPPHRALLGLLVWRLRPRNLAGLRRVAPQGTELSPLGDLALAPDLASPSYPRGLVRGPTRLLLRYPVSVTLEGVPRLGSGGPRERAAAARVWRLRSTAARPLHNGKLVEVPAGRTVVFEGEPN
ncbi:MAG: hypothetical protein ACHQCF_07305 [Solirubrobacterales bacterium]